MQNDSILATLKKSFIFQQVENAKLEILAKDFKLFRIEKNETIDYELMDKYFFIVSSGLVKMTKMDIKSGRSVSLFLYYHGDVFDLLPLFDEQEHDVVFTAVKKSTLYGIEIVKMREWIEKDPNINAAFFIYLAREIRKLEDFSESMVFYDAKTRLAKFLLKNLTTQEHGHSTCPILNDITHNHLAEIIGSIRSVITTELNKLKKDGILIKEESRLIINDLEKLQKKYHFH